MVWDARDVVWDARDVVWDARDVVWEARDTVWDARDVVWEARDVVWEARDTVWEARDVVWDARDVVWEARDVVWEARDDLSRARYKRVHRWTRLREARDVVSEARDEAPRARYSRVHRWTRSKEARDDASEALDACYGWRVPLSEREVVVIGAGPAGLAAALELQGRGVKVTVVEKAQEAGGRSGFDRVGDWRFDRGAEFLTSFYRQTLQLCSQVDWTAFEGLSLDMGRLILEGKPFVLPATPWKLLRTRLISARTKRHMFGFGWQLARFSSKVRWSSLEEAAPLDDQSAEDYFREVLGQDYVDTVLRATLESLTLSPLSDTSRVIGLSQAREAAGAKLLCPSGGLGALWLEVAKRLSVTTARAVTGLAATGAPGSKVALACADGTRLFADAAVVAVPAPDAVRLVPKGLVPERDTAERARYSPCVKLHLCLEKPLPGLVPCCAIGPGTNPLAGLAVLEQKGTGQAPDGKSGLVLVASPALAYELLSASDEEVERRLVPAAEALTGVKISGVVARSVVRLPEGVPLFYVGWLRELAARRETLAPAQVALAGDYLASPSIEGAVRTGQEAAARVFQWLATKR